MKYHGYSKTPIYIVWIDIKARCYNKKHTQYKDYGGRGIIVCDEWKGSPKTFIEWAFENGWEKGLTIDRADNDKGYSPENCRFVSHRENSLNKRLLRSNNTSGYNGVSIDKLKKKWGAYICIKGKDYYLGRFNSPRLAACRRDVEAIKHGYKTNF